MGKVYEEIDASVRAFIEAQRVFFVATAPSGDDGHVNLSPKGLDSFRVLDPRTVAYLDHTGSGAETIAHLRQNGRITVMFCAFEGAPNILRLYGQGEVIEPADASFTELRALFPPEVEARSVIRIDVERVADSCGFGVPIYSYVEERTKLMDWANNKGPDGLHDYQRTRNAASIDGLPALRWAAPED